MNQERWTLVDRYVDALFAPHDAALEATLATSAAAGLPEIQVTPSQGKLLMLLAQMCAARRVLEIGTLGGYSTIWLARALLAGGQVVTLEVNPRHAEVARANFARAGLAPSIDLRVGAALDMLPQIASENRGPFDLVFIDADKENNPAYFQWAKQLARPGSLIVVDNIVRHGRIVEENAGADVTGTRAMLAAISTDQAVSATAIQTVGSKGYDGLLIARVEAPGPRGD